MFFSTEMHFEKAAFQNNLKKNYLVSDVTVLEKIEPQGGMQLHEGGSGSDLGEKKADKTSLLFALNAPSP